MVSFTNHYNAISIDRLPSKTKIENSWRIHKNNSLLCNHSSPQLQRLPFLLETQKTTSLQQVTGGNSPNIVLKRMLRYFLKTPPLNKILEFQNQKKTMKFVQKENFEPKIKPIIENLQNELYQLKKNQAKGAKLRANIRQELEGSKTFFRVLQRQNMQIQTIFELHTDDNKSKYSKDILISAKKL